MIMNVIRIIFQKSMKLISKNKRVYFDYEITQTIEVWIILRWYEVKSLRWWKVNIKDAVALINDWELWLHNIDIPLYEKTNPHNAPGYIAKTKRKLLIWKNELAKLSSKIDITWSRLLVLEIYFTSRQKVKLSLWLWKRKKKVEKRSAIKERETKRQMQKEIRKYN